jgi:hypothetical protein
VSFVLDASNHHHQTSAQLLSAGAVPSGIPNWRDYTANAPSCPPPSTWPAARPSPASPRRWSRCFHEAGERFTAELRRDPAASDYDYAIRTLTAGRPGSWEAAAVINVVLFGNELNLYSYKASLGVDAMRATGPNPKRVHIQARDRIAEVLRRCTNSDNRYTEVPRPWPR